MIRVIQAMTGTEPGTVKIAEPDVQTRIQPSQVDPANDWLCAWCLNRVANEKDRYSSDGKSDFSFKNPEGIRFNILTFSPTLGCRQRGVPTLDHTWFPGHMWSYCVCDRCGIHLGWYYTGPTAFAGLIRDRIVRASLIMS